MGGLFAFKRLYGKQSPNISMHFQNSRSVFESARVTMSKLSDIRLPRSNNSNSRNGGIGGRVPHTTMIDEQEVADLSSQHANDDTRNLLG